jgi:pyruvate dehydrogenase E2 component (dihydrolipoamide acetyltransferase)
MAIKVLMPALSPTMSEGVINRWLVNIGDTVSAGDILAEIETDKATMEVEAVDEGKITHLIETTPDKQIAVNSVIALINGNKDEKLEDYNEQDKILSNNEKIEVSEQSQRNTGEDKNQFIETIAKSNTDQNTNFASPLVKKFSKDNNIDLTLIKGSGPDGRIIKKDIQNFELQINDENITIIEPSSIRKIIAERTTQTKNEVPHFYLTIETRMDKLINLRKKININSDIKISFNDLIVKACAMAIAKNPETNISWVNGKIHQYIDIDIAIAVALKEGLITPIVKNADKKGLVEISSEIKSLVKKANQNKLLPEEYIGGSTTISNLGMFGITEFQAIINPPQSNIIAVGSIVEKPVANSGIIEIGHTMKSTISADHRALDGAVAAKLLKDFSDILEDPFQIWLNSLDMEVI